MGTLSDRRLNWILDSSAVLKNEVIIYSLKKRSDNTKLLAELRSLYWRRTPYSLNMCHIFTYRTKNEQRLYFLTRSSHTYARLPYIVMNLQLECDMGWYQYTSHSENHSTECEKHHLTCMRSWYQPISHYIWWFSALAHTGWITWWNSRQGVQYVNFYLN